MRAEARIILWLYAALKRRSSTVLHAGEAGLNPAISGDSLTQA
jgi:hypothetical protein